MRPHAFEHNLARPPAPALYQGGETVGARKCPYLTRDLAAGCDELDPYDFFGTECDFHFSSGFRAHRPG